MWSTVRNEPSSASSLISVGKIKYLKKRPEYHPMASLRTSVLLMVILGLAASFNATGYILPSEANAPVSYTNFTLGSDQYSIVSVNNADAMLLHGDQLVINQSDIKSVLATYYSTYFYPSQDDLNALTNAIQAYNVSRNNGVNFKNQEEYACRSVLFIDGRVQYDDQPVVCRNQNDSAMCTIASELMYEYLANAAGSAPVDQPSDLLQPIENFGFASYGTDVILGNDMSMLQAAESDPTQMASALSHVSGTMGNLSAYKGQLEGTMFGLTINGTSDENHWGLCPGILLNATALDQMGSISVNLSQKMAPYNNLDSISSEIANSTQARLDYIKDVDTGKYYSDMFSSVNSSGNDAISQGQAALSHVDDDALSSKVENLNALESTIPEDIQNGNYSNLDRDISQYKNLTVEVDNLSASAMTAYNGAVNAKNSANSMLLILETKDSDPITMKELGALMNETEDINAQFRDGLTVSELSDLASNYSSIENRTTPLLSNDNQLPATRVLLMFRGFARRVNVGIDNVAVKTDVIAPQDIPRSAIPLGAFSLLVLVCFSSMAIVAFLYIFSSFRFSVPKTGVIFAAAFFCAMIALVAFSVFMFLFLGKTSTEANLQEFMSDFNSRNDTAIFVDLSNTTSLSDTKAMQSCASVLANAMLDKNKTWTMYTMTQSSCTRTSETGANSTLDLGDCMNMTRNASSSFDLSYSPENEVPKFAIIYQNRAQIKGNQDYYDSCPIVALFS